MSNSCRICERCGRVKDCTPEPLCDLCAAVEEDIKWEIARGEHDVEEVYLESE